MRHTKEFTKKNQHLQKKIVIKEETNIETLKIHPTNIKYRAGKGAGTFDSHLPRFFSEWVTRGPVMVV